MGKNKYLYLQTRHYKTTRFMQKKSPFTNQLLITAERLNITPHDVLFAQLVAAGADRGDAFAGIYHQRQNTTQEISKTAAAEHIKANPAISLLIRQYKRGKPLKAAEAEKARREQEKEENEIYGEGEEFKTRSGIIGKIIRLTRNLNEKDELTALLSLAKMQGLDKPDEMQEDERRRFVLTWLSHCRTCALMRLYLETKG